MDDFKVGDEVHIVQTLTGYSEDFEQEVDLDFWTPNTTMHSDSTLVFQNTQEEGALKVVMKQKNFYDGQFYNFTDDKRMVFDLTANPYVSIKLKVEPGATFGGAEVDAVSFLVSPWGPDSVKTDSLVRECDSPLFAVPDDGEWHTYVFDFGAKIGVPLWNGELPQNDYSHIQAILVETAAWPSPYEATFWMDDFRIGDQVVTGIEDAEEVIVREFALRQNYPNPFNPTTSIVYQIEKPGHVKLDVISITGQVVTTLVDKRQTSGNYNVQFDARSYASGMYFYRLQTDDHVAVKRMLLIK